MMRTTTLALVLAILLAFPTYSRSATSETRVLDVQWENAGQVGKVTIAFDNSVNYRTEGSPSGIVVDVWPAQLGQLASLDVIHPYVRQIWVNHVADNLARIRIDLGQPARYKTFFKTDPYQLIVLVIPPWMATAELPTSLGYEKLRVPTGAVLYDRVCAPAKSKHPKSSSARPTSRRAAPAKSCTLRPRIGYTNVHVLKVDPSDPTLEIRPGLAANMITGSETTSIVATRNEAIAAINGGYFAGQGFPLGLVVIDGELFSNPLNRRSVFAITRTGQALIETFEFQGSVLTPDNVSLWISSVNQTPVAGGVAIFTRRFGPLIPPHALVAVVRGDVVESLTWGRVMIPEDGYVLAVAANDIDLIQKHIHPGQRLRMELQLSPKLDLVSALGGGPRLVKEGREFIPFAWEFFTPHFYSVRTARTALGITAGGKLVLVTVDAGSGQNTGMNLQEVAQLMIRLGAREAMNLDGGGSATMVVGGRLVNDPVDGFERPIASTLLVLRKSHQ